MILMTADTVGGVWTYALQLAHGLSEHGVTVALATMGRLPTEKQRAEAAGVPGLELYESAFKLEWMEDPWGDVQLAGEWLLDLERHLQPDVVHLNGYAHGALPWRAPVLIVGHSCVLSWWEAVKGAPAPESYGGYRREVKRGLRAADAVVAPTRAMLNELEGHYGSLPNPTVIYNGRDARQFRPAAKSDFVLAAGRLWDEAKNVATLARIAPRLPWPIYVAGEDTHPEGGSAALPNVQKLGSLAGREMRELFSRSAVYALPARYEPFGLSVLEAALSGCALVLGDIPTLRELWEGAAVFVAPDDEEALAAALRRIIEDNTLRGALGERARSRAVEFTPERMVTGYLSLYGALASTFMLPTLETARANT
jgi:glycosyltransferase involved in cell wall biosynthesis